MGGDVKELVTAAERGDLPLLKYHLKMGVDPNYQHPELLTTPLIEAARYGHLEVIKCLLENGADPAVKSGLGGETALSVAKAYRQKKVTRFLKEILRG